MSGPLSTKRSTAESAGSSVVPALWNDRIETVTRLAERKLGLSTPVGTGLASGRNFSRANGYRSMPNCFIVAMPNKTTLSSPGMTANVIGSSCTAPHGVRMLTAIGTVLCVTSTGAPVAVFASLGPSANGIFNDAWPKLASICLKSPVPIDVKAEPESKMRRAMCEPTHPGKERSARKHSSLVSTGTILSLRPRVT